MNIYPSNNNCIIIRTVVGNIHVSEEEGKVKIVYYDHVNITIDGDHKQMPFVTIDSDEYPTRLNLLETESKWIKEK